MVRHALYFFIVTTSLPFFPAALRANTNNLDYKIGDQAEADVIAPLRLVVVDPEATAALKEREAQRVPVIYRFYPRAIDEVTAAFHSTFAATRGNFLDAVEAAFHKRKLDPTELSSQAFHSFVATFQKQNILFPVGMDLAALWAGGESGEQIESTITGRLRETMRAYIRSDVSPPDVWVGSTLRLVSLADNESTTARLVEERGNNVSKTNFVSLPRAKTELQGRFSPEDQAVGKYAASFVKPNCLMETDLTRELRARRTEGMVAADHYEAGQVIVRRGQVVDKKIGAALNQLKEKTAVGRLQTLTVNDQADAARNTERTRWLIGLSSGTVLVLLLLLWRMTRRESDSLLPARIPGGAVDWAGSPGESSWRERALRAEQRVEKAQAAARAGLISQLAHWLSDRMTRKLISQRTELIDAHQSAAIEIAEMEARLEKVHAPLQERLQAYERRIAELEKELTLKGEENRELIKAKIQIARKQLEIERGKSRLEFN
jgi:7TM-HD extracellular